MLRIWESEIKANLEGCVNKTIQAADNGVSDSTFDLVPFKSFADFFAGIGLMRLGLESQGWNCSYSNDIDSEKYEMYTGNFYEPDQNYVLRDIHDVSATDGDRQRFGL